MTASPSRRLVDAAARWCERRNLPAGQVAVARNGDVVLFDAVGDATTDNRFLIWSCTKGVVAAVLWRLVSDGRLAYDTRVADVIPEFATNGKDAVTVEQVMLHTAGFPLAPLGPLRWATTQGRREAFARWRLNWPPGSRYEYHQLAAGWVLGEVIAEVTARDHRDAIHEVVTDPLELTSFRLGEPEADQADVCRVVVTGQSATDDDYRAAGMPPLPPPTVEPTLAAAMTVPAALAVGIPGGGAVANAADIARFYQALLDDRLGLWDAGVLADGTGVVRNTFADTAKWGEPANRTRGMVVRGDDEPYASFRHHFGPSTGPRTFGHDGAGGQIAWADPSTGISFCFLTSGYDANRALEIVRNQELSALAVDAGLAAARA